MGIRETNFKTAVEIRGNRELADLPLDLIAGLVGALLLALVVMLLVVKRLNRTNHVPGDQVPED